MTPTKQEMLKKIYEVIADKTLSFGCMIKWRQMPEEIVILTRTTDYTISILIKKNIYKDIDRNPKEKEYEIIWHQVMLWDVLDWIEQKNTEPNQLIWWYSVGDINLNLRHLRTNKRKPIDDQSDECIDFIYSLIKDGE